MSRDIDLENPDSWTEDDIIFLRDRGFFDRGRFKNLPKEGLGVKASDAAPPGPAIGDVGLANYPTTGEGEDDDDDEIISGDYEDLTGDELKEELKRRGLKTGGSKQELIDRLEADDAGGGGGGEEEEEENTGGGG